VELVDRLESRRYVVRSTGKRDRRQVIVRLTASGSNVLRKLSLAHHEELEKAGPVLAQALRSLMKQTRVRNSQAA
jgi:DNA-binding MarR family transcriptional regulator